MFESNLDELDARATLASAARLHEQRTQIDIALVEHAQHFADLHPDPATLAGGHTPPPAPGRERGKVYGGPGCPAVAEFAPAEFGAVTGRGKVAAAHYIGQALALRHRLPETWEQVRNGHATEWKARKIATACLGLSEHAVAYVDQRVAHILDTLTPLRLDNIVRTAKWQADPEAARAEAEEKARERGVWPGRTDDHGTTTLFIKAATGDVIRLNATIAQIADALAALGDTDPIDQRRAKAVGIIADPALAHHLLEVARHLATTNPPADPTPAAASSPTPAPPTGAARPGAGHDSEPKPQAESAPATAAATEAGTVIGAEPATESRAAVADDDRVGEVVDRDWHWEIGDEPDAESEADRDSPHPSIAGHPLDDWTPRVLAPVANRPAGPAPTPGSAASSGSGVGRIPERGSGADRGDATTQTTAPSAGMDAAARRELAGKVAAIKQAAYRDGIGSGSRPARTVLYAHITDATLLAADGVARVEGFGPALVAGLSQLLGHDQIVIQPVIDLNDDTISVDAYEIPHRISEPIKLKYPIEQFPYGTAETGISTDLDHIKPYVKDGPPGQTSTKNLTPLGRLSHRIKTHGGWTVTRLDNDTLEWTTRHGFKLHVTHRGTYLIRDDPPEPDQPDKDRPCR
jgi:hypothetical protein